MKVHPNASKSQELINFKSTIDSQDKIKQGCTVCARENDAKTQKCLKRQFTVESYMKFFLDAGFPDVEVTLAEGRIPCAVAVMTKEVGR